MRVLNTRVRRLNEGNFVRHSHFLKASTRGGVMILIGLAKTSYLPGESLGERQEMTVLKKLRLVKTKNSPFAVEKKKDDWSDPYLELLFTEPGWAVYFEVRVHEDNPSLLRVLLTPDSKKCTDVEVGHLVDTIRAFFRREGLS